MNPNYPDLAPRIVNPIWFDVNSAFDEEAEVSALETDYQTQLYAVSQLGSDIVPIGKTGLENQEAPDSDDDDGNDDTDDTESHDEADDEEMVANHSIETI